MTDFVEDISIEDRYESLKLFCREQVLANEVLKMELQRLRKSINDISRQRSYLLEKLLDYQNSMPTISNSSNKERVSSFRSSDNIAHKYQARKADSSYATTSKRGRVNEFSVDTPSTSRNQNYEESSNRSYSNGHPRFSSSSSSQSHVTKRHTGSTSFLPPEDIGKKNATSSQRLTCIPKFPVESGPSDELSSFDDDFCEEPPVIYSKTKVKIHSSITDVGSRFDERDKFDRDAMGNDELDDNIRTSLLFSGNNNSLNCGYPVSPSLEAPLHYRHFSSSDHNSYI